MKIYLSYLFYILKHKYYVFLECYRKGLIWQGIIHDVSKFLPSEFFPYARYFYLKPILEKQVNNSSLSKRHIEKIKLDFNYAWLKHVHRNKHHWEYWILLLDKGHTQILSMPIKYRKEMICDWVGAGKAITGKNDVAHWYASNKNNIQLDEYSKIFVEREMTAYEK